MQGVRKATLNINKTNKSVGCLFVVQWNILSWQLYFFCHIFLPLVYFLNHVGLKWRAAFQLDLSEGRLVPLGLPAPSPSGLEHSWLEFQLNQPGVIPQLLLIPSNCFSSTDFLHTVPRGHFFHRASVRWVCVEYLTVEKALWLPAYFKWFLFIV